MEGLTRGYTGDSGAICSAPTRRSTLDNLKDKKKDLELRLSKVEEAIALFEDNPNIAKAIDLLSQV